MPTKTKKNIVFFIFLNIFSKKQYNPDLLEVTVTEITEMTSILFSGSEVP